MQTARQLRNVVFAFFPCFFLNLLFLKLQFMRIKMHIENTDKTVQSVALQLLLCLYLHVQYSVANAILN